VSDDERTEGERKQDRQMIELLNELRVALPGVQILFAFLLTVPFSQGFQRATGFQRNVFFVTLLATAVSAVCLIAPSATHRLRFHQKDRRYIIESANRLMIVGLVFLAVAIVGAVLLVTDFLFGGAAVWLWPGVLAVFVLLMWFVRPLLRNLRHPPPAP
jgi:hypothetical protein